MKFLSYVTEMRRDTMDKTYYAKKTAAALSVAAAVIMLIVCLTACSSGVPHIEGVDWKFAIRQSADGTAELVSPDMKVYYPDALEGEVSIGISDGVISVSDADKGTLTEGKYRLADKNDIRAVYLFESDGAEWTAVVSVTKHWDMHEGTLIVSNGEISYTFTADVTGLSD